MRRGPAPRLRRTEDPRYSLYKWQRVRKAVLQRDLWQCWARGCSRQATIADHIVPTTLDMPDWQFFSMDNLRASCADAQPAAPA